MKFLLTTTVLLSLISVSSAQQTIEKLECPSGSFPMFEKREIEQKVTAGDLFLMSLPGGSFFALNSNKKVEVNPKYCYKPASGPEQCAVHQGEQYYQQPNGEKICYVAPSKIKFRDTSLFQNGPKSALKPYEAWIEIPCVGSKCRPITGPADYILRIYQFGLMIAGLAGFGAIVYGGLKYTLSAGNISSQQDAKETITQALLGLALLLGAVLILTTIDPKLSVLKNPATTQQRLRQIKTCPSPDQVLDASGNCVFWCTGTKYFDPESISCKECPPGKISINNACVIPQ